MTDLGIVVPFYNEEPTARGVASRLLQALRDAKIDYQVVFVADGSTDRTRDELEEAAGDDARAQVVWGPHAEGYGAAILRGFLLLDARIVGWTDGDGQVPPSAAIELYHAMRQKRVALGMGRRRDRQDGWWRSFLSWAYNWTMRIVLGFRIHDINAKPKLLERDLLTAIHPGSKDWFIDTEIVAGSHVRGVTAIRVPVAFHERCEGESKVRFSIPFQYIRNLWRFRRRLRKDPPHPYPTDRSVSAASSGLSTGIGQAPATPGDDG